MKPYTLSELLDYFDAINCIADVQIIAEHLHDNVSDYSPEIHRVMKGLLHLYIPLFI